MILIVVCVLIVLGIIVKVTNITTKVFVWIVSSTDTLYAHSWRQELFRCMQSSKDALIVEIGAGGGANFLYYPAGSRVTCIEPLREFDEHLQHNIDRYATHLKTVNLVKCNLEDVPSYMDEGFANYVVCTYVLCSVDDVEKALRNIHYILKPGGTFCYLEHTQSDRHPMRLYQSLLTPIFTRLLNGCHYNRQPYKAIEDSGLFTEAVYSLEVADCLPFYRPERCQVWGRATKEDTTPC